MRSPHSFCMARRLPPRLRAMQKTGGKDMEKEPNNAAETTQAAEMLSARQRKFCELYLQGKSATDAYREAYGDKKSAGKSASRLLKNARIIAYMHELRKEQRDRLFLDENLVAVELVDLYRKAAKERPVMKWNPDTHQMEETGEYQFDGRTAAKALELLGKHLGMFVDKNEISGKDNGPVNIDFVLKENAP